MNALGISRQVFFSFEFIIPERAFPIDFYAKTQLFISYQPFASTHHHYIQMILYIQLALINDLFKLVFSISLMHLLVLSSNNSSEKVSRIFLLSNSFQQIV